MTSTTAPLEETVAILSQTALNGPPLIILGSGASIAYGVGGMKELGAHLTTSISPTDTNEQAVWKSFCEELTKTNNLEAALQAVPLPQRLLDEVIRATHAVIARDDRAVFERLLAGTITVALTRLLKHLFQSTHTTVEVVTTNYDRLAEYAANAAGFAHYSGFASGNVGLFDDGIHNSSKRRTVNVWKVHGSIDWFEDYLKQPICLPDVTLGRTMSPLLVTPGSTKYQRALEEPFRTIFSAADQALSGASAYVCVGFGFRDAHIEPKLVRRLKQHNAPFVILARTLTDEAKQFIAANLKRDYLALEKSQNGTTIYTSHNPLGVEVEIPDLWTLDALLDVALGKDK